MGVCSGSAPQDASASRIAGEFRQSKRHMPVGDRGDGLVSAERVLLVDNNPQIRWVVRNALRSHGYSVSEARSGEEALEMLQKEEYDLVLLDMHTPGIDVVEAPRAIRSCSDSAILVFRARETDGDQAETLKVGADDYLPKPFTRGELLARLRAVLDKGSARANAGTAQISLPGLEIDFLGREVRADGRESRLTPKEFQLLSYLVTHPNRVIRGRELLKAVWGPDQENKTECLRVIVNRLRDKIEPERAKPRYLLTEPWVGYRFRMPS
jgi:two-component system KDP operon response regulator KdpE